MSMNKRQRQQLIRQLVREQFIGSQPELVEALALAGCVATQATVSRDLRELGLQKGRDSKGQQYYFFLTNAEEKPNPQIPCARMLAEFGRGVTAAQNLLVLRCEPGSAPGLGRVIDELEHESILGCVAGDDTVIIVSKNVAEAENICAYLRELGG